MHCTKQGGRNRAVGVLRWATVATQDRSAGHFIIGQGDARMDDQPIFTTGLDDRVGDTVSHAPGFLSQLWLQ